MSPVQVVSNIVVKPRLGPIDDRRRSHRQPLSMLHSFTGSRTEILFGAFCAWKLVARPTAEA